MAIVLQHPSPVPLQQMRNGPTVLFRNQRPPRHVQDRRQHHQAYRFVHQQLFQLLDIELAAGQQWQLDDVDLRRLQQAQHRPVAGRFDHHGGPPECQHRDKNFQDAPQVGANVDVIGIPATGRRRRVAGSQRGAKLQLAPGLRGCLRGAWVLAQQFALEQQQRAVQWLHRRRFVRTEHLHAGSSGIDVQGLE
ncbi:hypothetical protein D3C84_674190 [compost metagenome]